jgi:hypothetical protein
MRFNKIFMIIYHLSFLYSALEINVRSRFLAEISKG